MTTGYQAYVEQQKSLVSATSTMSARKIIKANWDKLTALEKFEYDTVAEESREAYWDENPEKRPKGQPKKKRKKVKDPHAPKRPLSAYLLFCAEYRQSVVDANPSAPPTEMMKKLSQMWGDAPAQTKAKFQKMNQNDKLRFQREMAIYEPPPVDYVKHRQMRMKLDPNCPKKPNSAYILFAKECRAGIRAEHPEYKVTDVMKRIATEWKQINPRDKKKFEKMAKKERKQFDREMAVYVPPPPPIQSAKDTLKQMVAANDALYPSSSKGTIASGKASKKKRDPNRPKRPLSAYLLFINSKRASLKGAHPEATPKETMVRLATMWKNASASERKPFEVKAAQNKAKYDRNMASYVPPVDEEDDESVDAISGVFDAGASGSASAESTGAARGSKKKRPKRDPHAPKRPASAYLLYCSAKRKTVASAHKGAKPTEIMSFLAASWGKLGDGPEKKKWQDKAELAKKEHEVLMDRYKKSQHFRDWKAANGGGADATVTGGGSGAGSKKPKKAQKKKTKKKKTAFVKTALQFYSEAKYKKVALKNADADDAMIHAILRKKFDGLSDQRRIKYDELARAYAMNNGQA